MEVKWDRAVINDAAAGPVLLIKNLIKFGDRVIRLHKILQPDAPGQLHSHPATAIRIVLKGGYVEELLDGSRYIVSAPSVSVVTPELVHRIDRLLNGPSYTLWIRGKNRCPIYLFGDGWPKETKRKIE